MDKHSIWSVAPGGFIELELYDEASTAAAVKQLVAAGEDRAVLTVPQVCPDHATPSSPATPARTAPPTAPPLAATSAGTWIGKRTPAPGPACRLANTSSTTVRTSSTTVRALSTLGGTTC